MENASNALYDVAVIKKHIININSNGNHKQPISKIIEYWLVQWYVIRIKRVI